MQKMALNVQEVSQMLGVGTNAAYDLFKREDFPSIRVGKRIVVPVEGLQEWLRTQSQKSDSCGV